ncbi:ABC transporter permease [Streptococcus sp.]
MTRYFIKLLFQMFFILLFVSFLSFLLVYLAKGDPAESILNAQGIPYTKELLELKRAEMGLHDSFIVQYLRWLGNILHGNFGITYRSGAPVWDQLVFYFPNTLYLALHILLVTLAISLPLSFYGAYHMGSRLDRFLMTVCAFLNAIPNFVIGILLMLVFSVKLRWFPIQSTANELGLILPISTMALTMSSRYIPQLRTAIIEELQSPAVEGARGRGVPEGRILLKDVLYNTLPFVLTLVSLSLGSLLGGVAIIEYLFSWPGIGKMLIAVVVNRDYPLVQGAVLVITLGVLIVNFTTQALLTLLNPKARHSQQSQSFVFKKQARPKRYGG